MNFPSSPISYAVEITFACHNFCSACANVWEPYRHLTLRNWKDLFDRIAPPGNRQKYAHLIRITGGEPTLHKEFEQIIRYVDSFEIAHALFTTGRWKHPEKIVSLYQHCEHFIGMLISLHGSTKEAHNAFVESVDSAFDETCENIRYATQNGIDVFTNTVLTKYSCDQIDNIIDLSQQLGVEYAVFNRLLGASHPLEPTEEQLYNAVLRIESLQSEGVPCLIGNCVPKCFVENSSEGPNAGIEHCAISPHGLVRPDNLTSYVFGNIFEQSIEEIWQSEKAQWYRQQLPHGCSQCAELARCRGGAKSVTLEHGFETDPLMKEPIRVANPATLVFDPALKPIPQFTLRKEKFGYLVARYNWSVPVSFEAKPLLDAINGEHTLAEIQDIFGEESLQFIGYLYQEGMCGF